MNKNYISKYAISILDGSGNWDSANQTKLPYDGDCSVKQNYNIENLKLLNGVEGDSEDNFQSSHSLIEFSISQKICKDDFSILSSAINGANIGLYYDNGTESLLTKGYITKLNISAGKDGVFPELKLEGIGIKPIQATGITLNAPTNKPVKFNTVYYDKHCLEELEIELTNGITPMYLLCSSNADNYPNKFTTIERMGTLSLIVDSDNYLQYDDILNVEPPKIINNPKVAIDNMDIDITRFVVTDVIEKKLSANSDIQLYNIKGSIANDNINLPFVITIN